MCSLLGGTGSHCSVLWGSGRVLSEPEMGDECGTSCAACGVTGNVLACDGNYWRKFAGRE